MRLVGEKKEKINSYYLGSMYTSGRFRILLRGGVQPGLVLSRGVDVREILRHGTAFDDRAGWVSMMLLEWLRKQCNHPAQGPAFDDRAGPAADNAGLDDALVRLVALVAAPNPCARSEAERDFNGLCTHSCKAVARQLQS